MKRYKRILKRFFCIQDGMTSTEYAVMIGLIIVFCSSSISFLGGETESLFSKFNLAQNEGSTDVATQTATADNSSTTSAEETGTVAANDQQSSESEESQAETNDTSKYTSFRARMSYMRSFLAWYFS